jgi:hypothetical protein
MVLLFIVWLVFFMLTLLVMVGPIWAFMALLMILFPFLLLGMAR